MMQSTSMILLLRLFVLLGCAHHQQLLLGVNAELSPFYNFRVAATATAATATATSTTEDNNSNNAESKTTTTEQRQQQQQQQPHLRSRNLAGRYGYGNHHGHTGQYNKYSYNDNDYYDCESFYSKSHKKDKKSKKKDDKKEKHYKSLKKCKGVTNKPYYDYEDGAVQNNPNRPNNNNPNSNRPNDSIPSKAFMRFIMVREEAGTPVPGEFGIGDTLALNGQIYYWEDYEDNLMSDVPVGSFVTLCTGVSKNDDLLCTYEIVLGLTAAATTTTTKSNNNNNNNNSIGNDNDNSAALVGVGAFVANGPNDQTSENYMIITGTEFEFSKYNGGTLVTSEDLVEPYLYADLYLL